MFCIKNKKYNPYCIRDMIRCTIIGDNEEELIEIYNILKSIDQFKFIRIKNKLNIGLKVIHLNLIYIGSIICEV